MEERRKNRVGRRFGEVFFHRLVDLGIALSSEKDIDKLLEMILIESKEITNADGGTIYLVDNQEEYLKFAIMRTDSLNIALGGTTGQEISLSPISLYRDGVPNLNNVASSVYHARKSSNIRDAYQSEKYDFSGTKAFDEQTGFRSQSFLTVPMINGEGEVIGVLQLLNARNEDGKTITFDEGFVPIIKALTSQAAVALENQRLVQSQKKLWDALLQMIASSIDDKSPYTGGHCQRVPALMKEMAEAACARQEGVFKDFNLSEDEWYELHVACYLHDCGKITTPEYIVDKGSKLETIYNRIHEIRTRFEVLQRDAEIEYLKKCLDGQDKEIAKAEFEATKQRLNEEWCFVAQSNVGGEFMDEEDIAKLKKIGAQSWIRNFDKLQGLSPLEVTRANMREKPQTPAIEPLLGDLPEHKVDKYNQGELYNLSIQRGTLTEEERETINDHIVVTIKMLEQLPFPKKLQRVPEYAGGHHEKLDGTGYPRGLVKSQMSIPARMMAVADIFEALTAGDRPYKKAKTLSESLRIMSFMVKDQHIDADIFKLFLETGIWKKYAGIFLQPEQVDEINIEDFMPPAEYLSA